MNCLYFCEVEKIFYFLLGSLEELQSRADHFEDRINVQKEKKRQEQAKKDDIEEELVNLQNHQRDLLAKQGRLLGEAEVIIVHLLCSARTLY
jgi:DNA repair protein RAD50